MVVKVSTKNRNDIARYLNINIDFRTNEWRRLDDGAKRARINNLINRAKIQKKAEKKQKSKQAEKKFRDENLERRREQLREAQQRLRDRRKQEKQELIRQRKITELIERNAAKRIAKFATKRFKEQIKDFNVFVTFTADFYYMKEKIKMFGSLSGRNIEYERDYTPREQTNTITLPIKARKITYELVRKILKKYVESLIDEYGGKIWQIIIKSFKFTYVKVDYRGEEDIMQVPMLKVGTKNIDGYPDQTWLKNTGTCVFDYLQYKYQELKGLKQRFATYENINLMLNSVDPLDYDKDELEDLTDYISEGVTTYALRNLCRTCGLVLYALHDFDKTFHHYKPQNYNHHYPALVYRLSNNHIYPIEDIKKKKSIMTVYVLATKSDMIKGKIYKDDSIDIEKNVEIIENVEPIKYLEQTIKDFMIPSDVVFSNGVLKSFKLNAKQYVFNQDVDCMMKLCQKLEIDYTGQGIVTMINYIIDLTLGHPLPKSSPNKFVNDTLILAKKNRAHQGLINIQFRDMLENASAYDINKCYSYNLSNPKEDWFIIDFNDTWQDVKDFDYKKIKSGLYYVETDDNLLFKGWDIYSSAILEKAVEEGIKFKPIKQLIPSVKQPKNLFRKIIDGILKFTDGIMKDGKPLYKYMNNLISGLLGKSHIIYSKISINSNLEEILYSLAKISPDVDETKIDQIGDSGYYIYGGHKHIELAENNIAMYIQLLDASNIQLYDMMKCVGGCLLARKVDCVIVDNPNKSFGNMYGDNWGQFKKADHIPVVISEELNNTYKRYKFSCKWQDQKINDSAEFNKIKEVIENNKGILIQGEAGTGKSYVAKKLSELLGNCARIAPTNKAALNIKGQTIHKFLKLNKEKRISPIYLKKIKKNYKYIIVDEISMISKEIWHRLMLLKVALPELVFILIGDSAQLPPVEPDELNPPDDYFNHPAVMYLANNNITTLTKVYRYSPELKTILNIIRDDKEVDFSQYERCGFTDTRYNICFFNATRKAVNAYWNKKEKPADHLFIAEKLYDEYSQDVFVYENLPVIARKTIEKGDVCCNNEYFTVSGFDENIISLCTERDDELHCIDVPINQFQETFLLNYCSTVHKSQGETISQKLTIYDWNSSKLARFNKLYVKRLKYTALSRVELLEFNDGSFEQLEDKLLISNLQVLSCDNTNDIEINIKKKIAGHYNEDVSKGRCIDNFIDVAYVQGMIKAQNGICGMCHEKMQFTNYKARCLNRGSKQPWLRQFTIDRIDSAGIGHIKGNVRLACLSCNVGKKNNY